MGQADRRPRRLSPRAPGSAISIRGRCSLLRFLLLNLPRRVGTAGLVGRHLALPGQLDLGPAAVVGLLRNVLAEPGAVVLLLRRCRLGLLHALDRFVLRFLARLGVLGELVLYGG